MNSLTNKSRWTGLGNGGLGVVVKVYGMQGFGMSLTYIKEIPHTGDTDSLGAEFLKAGDVERHVTTNFSLGCAKFP